MDTSTSILLIPNQYQLLDMIIEMGVMFDGSQLLSLFDSMMRCHSILNLYKDQLFDAFDQQMLESQGKIVKVYNESQKYSIYEKYINEKLAIIIESHQDWNKYSLNFYTFCDLIKASGEQAILYLDKFMLPMCFVCVNYKDLEIRQYILEIIDYICSK